MQKLRWFRSVEKFEAKKRTTGCTCSLNTFNRNVQVCSIPSLCIWPIDRVLPMKFRKFHRCAPMICLAILISTAAIVAALANDHEHSSSSGRQDTTLERTISKSVPGTGWKVTVTEGPLEPRSIGSYALRFYVPHDPEWPFDNYVDGDVRVRDGSIDQLLFEDLNNDQKLDLVVVMRSAGSGNYQNADGYVLSQGGIAFLKSVEGLAKDANPLEAMSRALKEEG